jgi:hypothetical protein
MLSTLLRNGTGATTWSNVIVARPCSCCSWPTVSGAPSAYAPPAAAPLRRQQRHMSTRVRYSPVSPMQRAAAIGEEALREAGTGSMGARAAGLAPGEGAPGRKQIGKRTGPGVQGLGRALGYEHCAHHTTPHHTTPHCAEVAEQPRLALTWCEGVQRARAWCLQHLGSGPGCHCMDSIQFGFRYQRAVRYAPACSPCSTARSCFACLQHRSAPQCIAALRPPPPDSTPMDVV